MPHFDTTISVPTVVMVVIAFAAWVRTQTTMDLRVRALETWRTTQEHALVQVVSNTQLLRENNQRVTTLLEGHERRMIMMEDEQRFSRHEQRPAS